MDFNNIANMKITDFENIGKDQYNKGFKEALSVVTKMLSGQLCEDYNADSLCEHNKCAILFQLAEGIDTAKRNMD